MFLLLGSFRGTTAFAPLQLAADQVSSLNNERHVSDIRYVEWTGSKGMLPLQSYTNVMELSKYEGWMRKPIDSHALEVGALDASDGDIHISNSNRRNNKATTENKVILPLDPRIHLQPLYIDSHIVVVNKESGALSVPGPNRKPSVGGLVHEYFGNEEDDVDRMIVHRLDMDTSGVICYARSKLVLSILHDAFRSKSGIGSGDETVFKKYEALVCDHVGIYEGEIDLPLIRDRNHPPFMKVGIDPDRGSLGIDISLPKYKGYVKMMSKAPKESLTLFRVLAWEILNGIPVTRLELVPITGRTHQLRVHCAAIGHPIIGDSIYGYKGNGSPHGGMSIEAISQFPNAASESIQKDLFDLVEQRRVHHKDGEYNGNLCLHAKQLTCLHPITKAPMSFEKDAPF